MKIKKIIIGFQNENFVLNVYKIKIVIIDL